MLPLTALRTQIKWILVVFIVIFTASVGFMYGTGGSDSRRGGDFVVARINGEELRIGTFQRHLRSFIERNRITDLSDKQMPLIYKAVLDEMVSSRAVIDEAARLKIGVPAEDVNARLKDIESQYVTREQFMQFLRGQGSSLEQAKAEIGRQLAIEKMLDDVSGGVVVGDDEVAKLYETMKSSFTRPAGIEADVAQLKTKEAAEKLIAAAKKGDWGKAVESVSADVAFSTETGKPERVAQSEMKDTLAPLSKLADGEFTAPVEVGEAAWFVFRRVRAVPEDTRPLSEVSDVLRNMLLQSKKGEVQRDYVKSLTDKMNVEIVAEDLFAVPSADEPPADGGTPAEQAREDPGTTAGTGAPGQAAPASPAAGKQPAAKPDGGGQKADGN